MTANADITTVMKDKSNEINEIGYDEIEMDDDFGLDADQQGSNGGPSGDGLYEHLRMEVDKGQVPVRIDKYM